MRRKDREMSSEFGLSVIDSSDYGTLTIKDPKEPDLPYAIPLSIARIDHKLYFHTAKSGYKIDLLQNHAKVRLVFVDQVKIPNLYSKEELDQLGQTDQVSKVLGKVFTTEFASAIVTGTAAQVLPEENPTEYKNGIKAICEKYVPDAMTWFEAAFEMSIKQLAIFSIKIDSIKAKRKRYDAEKEEMKWQRME